MFRRRMPPDPGPAPEPPQIQSDRIRELESQLDCAIGMLNEALKTFDNTSPLWEDIERFVVAFESGPGIPVTADTGALGAHGQQLHKPSQEYIDDPEAMKKLRKFRDEKWQKHREAGTSPCADSTLPAEPVVQELKK